MHWKTKDGRVIDIKDLEDDHLKGIIKYVRRDVDYYRERNRKIYAHLDLFGDHGYDERNYKFIGDDEKFLEKAVEGYKELKNEAVRRYLDTRV
jgi:hypothetical protein